MSDEVKRGIRIIADIPYQTRTKGGVEFILCGVCETYPIASKPARKQPFVGQERLVCSRCWEQWQRSPDGIRHAQADDALYELDRGTESFLDWPWPELRRITAPMRPRHVYVGPCGFSGNGKSSVLESAVVRWSEEGVTGYILPLEQQGGEYVVRLACLLEGIDHALALTGRLKAADEEGFAWAKEARARIKARVRWIRDEWADTLHFSPAEGIDAPGIFREAEKAAKLGARYMVVDHLDHIEGETTNLVAESQRAVRATLDAAKEFDLIMLAASQLNMEIAKKNRLARYTAPQEPHLLMPGEKNRVASTILGIWRPLREGLDAETLRDARDGTIEAYDLAKPNRIAFVNIKERRQMIDDPATTTYPREARTGAKCELYLHQGRVVSLHELPLAEQERQREVDRRGQALRLSA